jgi:hypothetical protein
MVSQAIVLYGTKVKTHTRARVYIYICLFIYLFMLQNLKYCKWKIERATTMSKSFRASFLPQEQLNRDSELRSE